MNWYENRLVELGLLRGNTLFIRVGMLLRCPTLYLVSDRVDSIMYRGVEVHELAQRIGSRYGFLPEYEVRLDLDDKLVLVGHIDMLNPKDKVIIEVKTSRSKKVKPEHLRQARIYSWMIKTLDGEKWATYILLVHDPSLDQDLRADIEDALIKAKEKTEWTLEYKTLLLTPVPYSETIGAYVKERARHIANTFRKRNTIPRIPGAYCEHCPLNLKCREYWLWKK